jgi:hypothetical protein
MVHSREHTAPVIEELLETACLASREWRILTTSEFSHMVFEERRARTLPNNDPSGKSASGSGEPILALSTLRGRGSRR